MEAQIVYLHHLMMGAYCMCGLFGGAALVAVFYCARLVPKMRRMEREVETLKRKVRVLLKEDGVEINWHEGQSDAPPAFR